MADTDFIYPRLNLQVADFPVKNTSGSTITSGTLCKIDTSNVISGSQGAIGVIPTSAVTDKPWCVAVENIPAGQNGRVQSLEGTAVQCYASAATINAGDPVGPSATSGAVATQTAGSGHYTIGQAVTATTGNANEPVLVVIHVYEFAN